FLTIREETWSGDRLAFNLSALGQSAVGFIDVADDHVRLEVTLPWLLAVVAEKLTPAIRKEGTLMLEKKGLTSSHCRRRAHAASVFPLIPAPAFARVNSSGNIVPRLPACGR